MNNFKLTSFILFTTLIFGCGAKQNADNAASDTVAYKPAEKKTDTSKKVVLFFGDSLTAGYGLDDPSQAFPGVIGSRIDSLKLPYTVVNTGILAETSGRGLSRIDWVLRQKVSIFVLGLGANDGLQGMSVQQTAQNLQAIIDKVWAKYPQAKIILLGMRVPTTMGAAYVADFNRIFPALAKKNKIGLVPFLLAGVSGNPKLNQNDGIHPTAEGAKIVANNVWKVLQPEL